MTKKYVVAKVKKLEGKDYSFPVLLFDTVSRCIEDVEVKLKMMCEVASGVSWDDYKETGMSRDTYFYIQEIWCS